VLEKLLQEITYYHTKALRGIMYKMKGVYTTPSIRIKGLPCIPTQLIERCCEKSSFQMIIINIFVFGWCAM
jgi:hypothetical protein